MKNSVSNKKPCVFKETVNILFAIISSLATIFGLIGFIGSLFINFKAGTLAIVNGSFGGLLLMWFGLFGLYCLSKSSCTIVFTENNAISE